MRKILISVLSVAGLMAVVLALAVSPASTQDEDPLILTITTDTDAGTYTVTWETQGGCDPGPNTSGASGSASRTVAPTTPGGTEGTAVPFTVTLNRICRYTINASFVSAAGAACLADFDAGAGNVGPDLGTGTSAADTIAVGNCATMANLAVTVKAPGTNVGDCISAGTEDTPDTADDCDLDGDNSVDTGTRPATADDVTDARSVGAVSATTFTITATPQEVNGSVPEGCEAVSEDTETDYDDNNLQKATLTVVDRRLGGTETDCVYTVTAALPAGFAAGDGSARSVANSQKDQQPAQNTGPDATADTADDNTIVVPDLLVSVAAVKVYLVQNVIGDAGGANATYKLDTPCGAPGLPGALTATPASGGISQTQAVTVVELREGRFNITAAIAADPSAADASDGVIKHALEDDGDACEATVSVSGIPDHCSAEGVSTSLASASGSVILEVTVDCSPPAAPEPPADDGGDMDMGGDDMDMGGDDMDMGGDDMDMGGDDMDMGGDDMDMGGDDMDMGPPEDVATG